MLNLRSESIPVKYDGRFGHEEHCTACFWDFSPERVGERWRFELPTGRKLSVIRNTKWDYSHVAMGLSTAASMGFISGLYEIADIVVGPFGESYVDEEGYMTFEDVRTVLDNYCK